MDTTATNPASEPAAALPGPDHGEAAWDNCAFVRDLLARQQPGFAARVPRLAEAVLAASLADRAFARELLASLAGLPAEQDA